MIAETFLNDIPLELFVRARSGISFTPEKYGQQERDSYAAQLAQDYADLSQCIASKPDMQATLDAEFSRYREGYKAKLAAKLHSDSRCISWMITGPANFPVARNEKRNRIARKRSEELTEFRKRALSAIRKTLCPELRPIMSGDSDAVERLQAEIESAEKRHEMMKECNVVIRANKDKGNAAQVAALATVLMNHGEGGSNPHAMAIRLLEPIPPYPPGYASFELTNNGANIRRMKQRLEHLKATKQAKPREAEGANARLEDCPADNRVRLFYPGKPDADVRGRLKSCGFRWTPTLGCWQAYRNPRTIAIAEMEAGIKQQETANA